MNDGASYIGEELALFGHAVNWKSYVSDELKPFVRGAVAEIGAGTGNFSPYLQNGTFTQWTYVEPDPAFRHMLQQKIDQAMLRQGVITASVDTKIPLKYDTILYLDVLEHIEDDTGEINLIVRYLNTGGHLIILSPAFQLLYSPFDKEIGHFRRYTKKRLIQILPDRGNLRICRYLDSAGFFGSLANRLLLNQKYPTLKQIKYWDKSMVPLSRIMDKMLFNAFGRSVLAVWQKNT